MERKEGRRKEGKKEGRKEGGWSKEGDSEKQRCIVALLSFSTKGTPPSC
jgi:hypothetical protein